MTMNVRLRILALGAAIVLLGAARTQAATISFVTTTPVASTKTDWSSFLDFQEFDPSLGTLTSIEIQTSEGFDTTLTVTNESGSSSGGTLQTEIFVTLTDPSGLPAGISQQSDTLIPSSKITYSLAPGGSYTTGTYTGSATTDATYVAPAILTEFTGSALIDIPVSTLTFANQQNTGGNTTASQVTHASATGDIIYTYTEAAAVPEPASFGLIGLGLCATGLLYRRRLARQRQ
jgi:hypothetical protein